MDGHQPSKKHDMKINTIKTESAPEYSAAKMQADDEQIIAQALRILERLHQKGQAITSPDLARSLLRIRYHDLPHEIFGVIFLDNQHRVIEIKEIFRGTIDGASVYPREVVKECLLLNSAAVMFFHNHPSGICEPSEADRMITSRLKQALSLVDVRCLDHFIVSGQSSFSFAEHSMI